MKKKQMRFQSFFERQPAISFAMNGGFSADDRWDTLSGIWGIYTSIIKIDEIAKKYEKGEKWLKEEANAGWVQMIGAYRDETYIIRRRVDPCLRRPRSEPDDCNDEPYFEDFTATRRIYEDSDALVPLASQRNPREPNWTPANTTSQLNLEVRGANHFSQANHPSVRRQLDRTFSGDVHPNNPPLQNAFRVFEKK